MTSKEREPERTPIGVLLWFIWAFGLLGTSGLLLGRIVEFVDFSAKAPFSLLGIFMMLELAVVVKGQRKEWETFYVLHEAPVFMLSR